MREGITAWECSAVLPGCSQVPICKGCLQPQTSTGAPIWEFYCANKDCKRTPAENLRDLFDPKLQRYRIIDMSNGECQESIHNWVHDVFPEWSGVRARALAIVEEAIELAFATGLSYHEMRSAIDMVAQKEVQRALDDPNYKPEDPKGEIADVYINVLAYAEEAGFDARKAMNEKMKKNRSRPKEHYLAKTEAKKKLGLQL